MKTCAVPQQISKPADGESDLNDGLAAYPQRSAAL